jgi:hypothetical protein
MRYLKLVTLTLVTVLVFFSCDPCKNLDCIFDNYEANFRIVSAANGNDLVFGPTKIYNKNQIKFYSLKGADTTFFPYQASTHPTPVSDSVLQVRFFPKADTAYMRLSNGDVDTFKISYNTLTTRCCGTVTEITNLRFNNSLDIAGSRGGTQVIRK